VRVGSRLLVEAWGSPNISEPPKRHTFQPRHAQTYTTVPGPLAVLGPSTPQLWGAWWHWALGSPRRDPARPGLCICDPLMPPLPAPSVPALDLKATEPGVTSLPMGHLHPPMATAQPWTQKTPTLSPEPR
jgi:hypothetical protein